VNSRALAITVIAVVATAISVVIGGRAIMGTAATMRQTSQREGASPGDLERTGSEIELLLEDMAQARMVEGGGAERDPMVPYKEPRKATPASRPTAPRGPSYKVTAVVIDQDPTAILMIDGVSKIVRVGETIEGGRVVAIESDGVTIEGDDGKTKLYSPSD
jgi:hypothetical protein